MTLHERILAAHAAGDARALARLYAEAADAMEATEEKWFFLTQAYVFALDSDAPEAPSLHARLCAAGRDS